MFYVSSFVFEWCRQYWMVVSASNCSTIILIGWKKSKICISVRRIQYKAKHCKAGDLADASAKRLVKGDWGNGGSQRQVACCFRFPPIPYTHIRVYYVAASWDYLFLLAVLYWTIKYLFTSTCAIGTVKPVQPVKTGTRCFLKEGWEKRSKHKVCAQKLPCMRLRFVFHR